MSTFILRLEENAGQPMANLDDVELLRIDGLATRYGEALNERVRVVSAMRAASIASDEAAHRAAEGRF